MPESGLGCTLLQQQWSGLLAINTFFCSICSRREVRAKLSLATYVALESKSSIYIHYRGFSQQHYILARPTIYKDSAGTGKKRGPSFCTTVLTPKERLLRLETQGMQLQMQDYQSKVYQPFIPDSCRCVSSHPNKVAASQKSAITMHGSGSFVCLFFTVMTSPRPAVLGLFMRMFLPQR